MAGAVPISIETFSPAQFAALTSQPGTVVEDFESSSMAPGFVGFANPGAMEGELAGALSTSVGTFSSLGGSGSGSTCKANSVGGSCSQIALENDEINGQGNLLPTGGEWSVSSNDTLGVRWVASLGGTLFTQAVFAIRDAVDQSNNLVLSITSSEGGLATISGRQANDTRQIVVVNFGGAGVSSATIDMVMNDDGPNDAFTIDGASLTPVPLPASALLLLGGVAAIGAARRKRSKS